MSPYFGNNCKSQTFQIEIRAIYLYSGLFLIKSERLFWFAGHIAPYLMSRGPHFSQKKGQFKAKKLTFAGRMLTPLGPDLDVEVICGVH